MNPFDDPRLQTTEALVDAFVALDRAIEVHALAPLELDRYTSDLLTRLMQAPNGQLRGVDIASQLLISTSRTTRLLDSMEAAGLVQRRPDPNDRRAQQISLTPAGIDYAMQFGPRLLEIVDNVVMQNFDEDERSTLTRLLRKLQVAANNFPEED